MESTKQASRRVVNGTWYEVCVSVDGQIRDVVEESSMHDAETRVDALVKQWPKCDMVFVRQHRRDPENQPGGSRFAVLHKLTADFRFHASNCANWGGDSCECGTNYTPDGRRR